MSTHTGNIFLYVHSETKENQIECEQNAFINAGYSLQSVRKAESVLDLAITLPVGACIVVYSIRTFKSTEELVAIMQLFQEKGLVIRSLSEPWINVPVIEYIQNLSRIKQLSDYIYDDWINKTKLQK